MFGSYCSWLLLLSGDIEINPGPVRYPCTVCAKPVRVNQRGVMCDTVKGEIIVGLNNCVFADTVFGFLNINCGLMIANRVFTWYRNCI